jgi:hypothetical protein
METETTVKQRLISFVKYLGIGQGKFEKKAGLSNGYINNIRQSIQPGKLKLISEAFPELSTGWLMSGEGSMLKPQDGELVADSDAHLFTTNGHGVKFYKEIDTDVLWIEVPLIPYDAYASLGSELDRLDADRDTMETVRFKADKVCQGAYYAFRVKNDSMDDGTRNGLAEGDVVLVRELDRSDWAPRLRYKDWPFWVVVWDNNVRIKQIIDEDTKNGTITLHSLNPSPEYTDFKIHLDHVQHLFNVIKVRPSERSFKF